MSPANTLSNYLYEEIAIGQTALVKRKICAIDIQLFAALSGDFNPVHIDATYAKTTVFGEPIAHGMLCGALISAAIAMHLPGPGSVYRQQSIKFSKPVFIGDELSIELSVIDKKDRTKLVSLQCTVKNQHGKIVASGEASVIAPSEKLLLQAAELPSIYIDNKEYVHSQ